MLGFAGIPRLHAVHSVDLDMNSTSAAAFQQRIASDDVVNSPEGDDSQEDDNPVEELTFPRPAFMCVGTVQERVFFFNENAQPIYTVPVESAWIQDAILIEPEQRNGSRDSRPNPSVIALSNINLRPVIHRAKQKLKALKAAAAEELAAQQKQDSSAETNNDTPTVFQRSVLQKAQEETCESRHESNVKQTCNAHESDAPDASVSLLTLNQQKQTPKESIPGTSAYRSSLFPETAGDNFEYNGKCERTGLYEVDCATGNVKQAMVCHGDFRLFAVRQITVHQMEYWKQQWKDNPLELCKSFEFIEFS